MSFRPGFGFPGVGHGFSWCGSLIGVMAGVIWLLVPLLGWVVNQRIVFRLCWLYGFRFSGSRSRLFGAVCKAVIISGCERIEV